MRSVFIVADVGVDALAAADHVVDACLDRRCEEADMLAFALGVVREQTLAPQAFTPEGVVAQLHGHVSGEVLPGELGVGPGVDVAYVRIVVVAVFVAETDLLGFAVGEVVVKVVLDGVVIGSEVTLGEVVEVQIVLGSEQVSHDCVVFGAVDLRVQAAHHLHP